jgi:hypothetical protein
VRQLPEAKGFAPRLTFSPDGRTLAVFGEDKAAPATLYEVASGKVRLRVGGHAGGVKGLAFSPDGRLLATGGDDTTALLWDLRALALADRTAGAELSDKRLDELWAELSGADGEAAYRAVLQLARAPRQTVPFFRRHLGRAEAKGLDKLIAQLDDDDFATRERATEELISMGRAAEAAVRKAAENGSAEVRVRTAKILERLATGGAGDQAGARALQAPRALEALELAGTVEARRLIEEVAKGAPEAELTREAKAALERLRGPKPDAPAKD